MMVRREVARAVSLIFLLVLAAFYVITIGLASWVLNRVLEESANGMASPGLPGMMASLHGNAVTPLFALTTLISGVVGVAAVLLGLHHGVVWKTKTLVAATAATMIAWLLSLLAMGLACREVSLGGRRDSPLRSLEGFVIFLPWILLVQMVTWQASMALKPLEPRAPVTNPRMTV